MVKMGRKITFVNSQRKVNCGVCDDVVTFRNLHRDFSLFHKGETPREKAPEGIKSLKTDCRHADFHFTRWVPIRNFKMNFLHIVKTVSIFVIWYKIIQS
jgi:hypothetical protein